MKLEIMDTTLRDGEQTSGVSFNALEKLSIARILMEEVKIDRLEVASARVSEGEYEAVEKIINWAGSNGYIDRIEILGFIDKNEWIESKVAQFRFKPSNKHWTLYYADRNNRWHEYWEIDSNPDLDVLLQEMDEDPTGIFWG